MILIRDARGKIDKDVDKEFDNIIKQIENIINDKNVKTTMVFYTSETSGGTADVKNTVKINQYGFIINWEQV